ncbi:hypothetical protein Nepgr_029976 [Nepenthes gracilis]|uniref:Uncharacterized protein n=1 Tax=Nepenthes gracilis TaxID=150966 RepID=A0AAD3TFI8_NEPGR|nr:hypothetical protein Nepgr_029976 [Nepenthes gracilis]
MHPEMDRQKIANEKTGNWTNEKHLHFLSFMEATFVRTMLESNAQKFRLDRYVPDISESTRDLKALKRSRSSDAVDTSSSTTRTSRRRRRSPTDPYNVSHDQDQVDPLAEGVTGSKK